MIKRTTISLRIDKKTKDKLQALEDKSGMSKSDVVRQGIKMMYEEYLNDDTTNDGNEQA
jgi:antitoxin component of RelBE/YafQ-DinJ toxin-antitoxin module